MVRRIGTALLAMLMLGSASACGKTEPVPSGEETEAETVTETAVETAAPEPLNILPLTERNNVENALCGTDALGREIRPAGEGNGRLVGMFYTLWLGNYFSDNGESYFKSIYDMSKMDKNHVYSGGGSPFNQMHFFGQPLFGYYNQQDRWVVDRHVQMFIAAGVDFLAIDATNNDFYPEPLEVLLETLESYRVEGYRVPQIMFLTNTDSRVRVTEIYNHLYKDGRYRELWFCDDDDGRNPDKKPWITIRTEHRPGLNRDISATFYFRASQWPNERFLSNGFPWIEFDTPQPVHNGIISVSVAQNTGLQMSNSVQYERSPKRGYDFYNQNRGRGYTDVAGKNDKTKVNEGANFEEQWNTAIASDARIAFVLGWNEWAALKLATEVPGVGHTVVFYDLASVEFSRDIEPIRGAYGDNFYLQLIRKIREFKGMSGAGIAVDTAEIREDAITNAWNTVASGVADFAGVAVRDHKDCANRSTYQNESRRNDIVELRCARNGEKISFLITTKEPITEERDDTWMNLWIRTEGAPESETGYHYVINRSRAGNVADVERLTAEGSEIVGTAVLAMEGNHLQITLDGALLGKTFEGKVTDNVKLEKDILNLYTNGDAAPYGRLNYGFRLED